MANLRRQPLQPSPNGNPVSVNRAIAADPPVTTQPTESPLSLRRLRDAFAAMLKPQDHGGLVDRSGGQPSETASAQLGNDPCETNPRSVTEAMLFVGRPDDGTISARELAAAMRGVSPGEIDAVVGELNATYEQDGAPYAIVGSPHGYRLALREEFLRVRDRFYGRAREARLSPAALEVLAVVGYHQPITMEEINRLRGSPSGTVIATLVRRRLLRIDRPQHRGAAPQYFTTERFLRLFGLESLAALPRTEELESL